MATATILPKSTSQSWRDRAIELYQSRAVLYGWRRVPMAARPGVEMFVVLSGEQHQTYAGPRYMATREHMVFYIQATGEVRCDCPASAFSHHQTPCWHCGQILSIKEQDARAQKRASA
jgi:hypothetical protein